MHQAFHKENDQPESYDPQNIEILVNASQLPLNDSLTAIVRAAQMLKLSRSKTASVLNMEQRFESSFEVRLENGSTVVISWYYVAHSRARGPLLCSVYIGPEVSPSNLITAAFSIALQTALLNLPFGGAAAGVVCDWTNLSPGDRQAVIRGWCSEIRRTGEIRRTLFIPAAGVAEETMADIQEGLIDHSPVSSRHLVIGKPVSAGGTGLLAKARAQAIAWLHMSGTGNKPDKPDLAEVFQEFGSISAAFAEYRKITESEHLTYRQHQEQLEHLLENMLAQVSSVSDIHGCNLVTAANALAIQRITRELQAPG